MSKKHGFKTFLFGAFVGAGIALLLAPQSGKETRKMLKIKMDNLKKKLSEIEPEDVKEKAVKIINDIKDGLSELDQEKAIELIKEKSIWIAAKADDLVHLAVEKGTPVFESAARDIKRKTSIVLKDLANKIDESEDTKKAPKKKAKTNANKR